MFDSDPLADCRQQLGTREIVVRRIIDEVENPPGGGQLDLRVEPESAQACRAHHNPVKYPEQDTKVTRRHRSLDDAVGDEYRDVCTKTEYHHPGTDKQQRTYDDRGAFTKIGFLTAFRKPLRLLLHATQALHGVDARDGLFQCIGGSRTRRAFGLVDAPHDTGHWKRDDKDDR